MAGLMIAAKLAQRRFVQLKQNVAQLIRFRITCGEALGIVIKQAVSAESS